GVDAAELPAGRAVDDQTPAAHPRPGPVAGVALDVQLAAGHPGARVHPGRPGDGQPPGAHRRPDELDPAEVALDAHVVLARAGDVEERADTGALVAVPH